MLKLCVLAIVVAAVNCQQAADPLPVDARLSDPRYLDPLHRNRLYYPNPGRIPPYYYGDETPKPFAFSYTALHEDGVGSSSRREVGDATGRVEGSYSLTNDEGHSRVVQYVADQAGFRANIQTNEPGTDNQNPADVVIESNAPTVGGRTYYRGDRPIIRDRPLEVSKDAESPDSPVPVSPPRPTPVPWYQRAPPYSGRFYPRYGRPYRGHY